MLGQTVGAPSSDADPFSAAYFDDPFPTQQALRDAGPAVFLTRYGVWAVARFADVRAMFLDPATFCSAGCRFGSPRHELGVEMARPGG